MADQQWETAMNILEEIAARDPNFRDMQGKWHHAHTAHQMARWYEEAREHNQAGEWAEACQSWVRVLRRRLEYREDEAVSGLLEAADGLLNEYEQLTRR